MTNNKKEIYYFLVMYACVEKDISCFDTFAMHLYVHMKSSPLQVPELKEAKKLYAYPTLLNLNAWKLPEYNIQNYVRFYFFYESHIFFNNTIMFSDFLTHNEMENINVACIFGVGSLDVDSFIQGILTLW